jgi:hypothetical protein
MAGPAASLVAGTGWLPAPLRPAPKAGLFEHWSYEQEHRLFVRLEDKEEGTDLYFFDFGSSDGLTLREVIVGAQSPISPEEVAQALGDLAPKVAAWRARLASRTFEVVRRRNDSLWRPSRRRLGLRDPTFEALVDRALKQTDFTRLQPAAIEDQPGPRIERRHGRIRRSKKRAVSSKTKPRSA